MSTPANDKQPITAAEFGNLQTYQKWSDLKINKIYTVINTRMVGTQYGTSMVLTLLDNGEVWAPESLKNKIVNSDTYFNPPFYVRPLGLKPCKKDRKNKYQAYDVAAPQ